MMAKQWANEDSMDSRHLFVVEMFQLSRAWRTLLDERLKPEGHTKASWALLFWLSRSPEGMTQGELADIVGIENSTLTRQLDSLEGEGLVQRMAVPGDRRSKRVRLTERAWPQLEVIGRITRAVRDELMADITTDDVETGLRVMQHLHAKLER